MLAISLTWASIPIGGTQDEHMHIQFNVQHKPESKLGIVQISIVTVILYIIIYTFFKGVTIV